MDQINKMNQTNFGYMIEDSWSFPVEENNELSEDELADDEISLQEAAFMNGYEETAWLDFYETEEKEE